MKTGARPILFVALAIGLAWLAAVDCLLQRADLPRTPVWSVYYVLKAAWPVDGNQPEVGASMSDTSQKTGQTTNSRTKSAKIAFLHHSTGWAVWLGGTSEAAFQSSGKSDVKNWVTTYNAANDTHHQIEEIPFPRTDGGYPWANYPYDYYNIWVKHAGNAPYRGEPTLEMLTSEYDVIVLKHCFPVAGILRDTRQPNVDSEEKRLENYKLQYAALKEKMLSFPHTKFILWTGAAPTIRSVGPMKALRARHFFDWVKSEWDEPGDNIYLWDFYKLETEGGIYMKTSYASGLGDPHPRRSFAAKVAPLLARRIIDVINGVGDVTSLTGEAD